MASRLLPTPFFYNFNISHSPKLFCVYMRSLFMNNDFKGGLKCFITINICNLFLEFTFFGALERDSCINRSALNNFLSANPFSSTLIQDSLRAHFSARCGGLISIFPVFMPHIVSRTSTLCSTTSSLTIYVNFIQFIKTFPISFHALLFYSSEMSRCVYNYIS